MSISKEQIIKALSRVDDPDFKKDLVTLKMIEDVEVSDKKVSFTVVLTTPACPMKDKIKADCINEITDEVGPIEIQVNFTSRVTSPREKTELIPGVKNVIAVASGKGGVGKSMVATNLALGLAESGAKVGIIDADIYGPSLPLMLGLHGKRPKLVNIDGQQRILPLEKYGLKALSIGFLIDQKQAVVWRGPMASSTLRQFFTDCEWGELDYLILDLPPGTGDIHLTLVQTIPITGAVIVTTPQEMARADAIKAIAMFKMAQINLPILGVVENMAWFTPEELPNNKYYLFGKDGGKKMADDFELPLLAQIPIIQAIQAGSDEGKPAILDKNSPVRPILMDLSEKVAQEISLRNSKFAATEKVQMDTF